MFFSLNVLGFSVWICLSLNPLSIDLWTSLQRLKRGSEWGYLNNTRHFIFWFCQMKQLNFMHLNTNSKKFFEIVIFFQKETKKGSKKTSNILFSISGSFRPFYNTSGLFQKISEGYRRFPKTNVDVRWLPKMSEEPSKHLTVFSSETVNCKKKIPI